MKISDMDFSVLDKLNLPLPAIGVKFDLFRPKDCPQLPMEEKMSLCEMFRKCQDTGEEFYFGKDNDETCVGKCILGMEQFPGSAVSGQIGQRLGVWQDPRGNRNVYRHVKLLAKDSCNYVRFCPSSKLTFMPDVLVLAAPISIGEKIMRATTYATGMPYQSKSTAVMGCSWFLTYPYETGEVNFMLPGLVHGPHGRHLWEENTMLISIPFPWIPTFLASLEEMPLDLTGHESKSAYYAEFEGILADLAEEMKNP
ncbi:MAG: DUF169 domain-containing protein [Oscillospiraceae bacterium]|nr:DUF169 domain-containing protein [Oscillospiraceae bacterium]